MIIDDIPCQVAILAGGMGTRLKARTGKLPKPMAPVMGRPVLEYQIDLCRRHGFTRIALLVHYEHEAISNHFGDGTMFGVELLYLNEKEARGTAGALLEALPYLADRFLVLYGDTYVDVNLEAMWDSHIDCGASVTLFLHPNDHPFDSDLVEVDENARVVAMHPYPHTGDAVYRNLVNAALYVMERDSLLDVIPAVGKSDLAKDTFTVMLIAGMYLHAYVTPEYIKDMGTPDRLDKVERDIVVGLPDRLSTRQLRSAVFLDRDGTINVEINHLRSKSQLQLISGAAEAVRTINSAGLLAVGITNQPVVARGDVSWQELGRIHAKLDHLLGNSKAYLDRIYVCPHHPDGGFPGEVSELKFRCECRKPDTGLLDRAARELSIDRRKSWMVGDSTSDILAGARAGLRTVMVRTGYAGLDGKHLVVPDYVVPDLSAAADWIVHGHGAMARQLLPVTAAAVRSRLVLIGGPARAGKSSAAQVLAEQLSAAGRIAHVLSLDGWLQPIANRTEGAGVLKRYDLARLFSSLMPLLHSRGREGLMVPRYERKSRTILSSIPISVGPEDVLIVEGVPALMNTPLLDAATVRLFIDVNDDLRYRRLLADYAWRAEPEDLVLRRLRAREDDELPEVRTSAINATHSIFFQEKNDC
ncbi:MAG: HAD-IIIA family hydrolase [Gallionellaceae bacterium]